MCEMRGLVTIAPGGSRVDYSIWHQVESKGSSEFGFSVFGSYLIDRRSTSTVYRTGPLPVLEELATRNVHVSRGAHFST